MGYINYSEFNEKYKHYKNNPSADSIYMKQFKKKSMAKGIKTGGREAGTPNKLTKELREVLKNILYKEIDLLVTHFEQLEAKDRIELLIKLLPYAIPKVEAVNYKENEPFDFADW